MSKKSTVVIIGRTNVGKSSLFNRITESGKALISKIEGTTRDYNLATADWRKKTFDVIDTGGVDVNILKQSIQAILPGKQEKKLKNINSIEKEILEQTKVALKKADIILMVVDGQAGLLPQDKELALVVKKLEKPIFLACNKLDSLKHYHQLNDFFKLGLGQPFPLSAINGSGVGDFLDELVKEIKGQRGRPKKEVEKKSIKVAIIGKPNVGKSSLVNKILGEKRVIVSPIAHTTREPQDTEIIYKDKKIILVDTAGLRKKAKIERGLEKLATRKTINLIKSADIVLLLTEANEPLGKQDQHLGGLIKNSGAGILIVANKWDLVEDKDEKTDNKVSSYYQRYFPYLSFASIIFTSGKTGKNVDKILDLILEINTQLEKEIPEEELEKILKKIVRHHRPAKAKGLKRPKLYSIVQNGIKPPRFTVTIGKDQSVHFSYIRFIENQLRENFGFIGVPVIVKILTKRE